MKKEFFLMLTAFLWVFAAIAQQNPAKKFQLYYGQKGITRKLSELKGAAASGRPLNQQPASTAVVPLRFRLDEAKDFKKSIQLRNYPDLNLDEEDGREKEAVTENAIITSWQPNSAKQTVWSNFLASTFNETPFSTPPDPTGDVGGSQVAVVTNNSIKVFEKRSVTDPPLVTTKGASNITAPSQFFITLFDFFLPVSKPNSFIGDVHVRYDRLTKRWFIVADDFAYSDVVLAVSDGDKILDTTSFTYYRFSSLLFPYNHNVPNLPFFDYPTLGIDKNAVLIGGTVNFTHTTDNVEQTDSVYFVGYVIDKKRLLHGQLFIYALPIGSYNYNKGMGGGVITPQGVQNDDPTSNKSFFAGINYSSDGIILAQLTYNNVGQLTGLSEITVPVQPYQFPRDITAPGSPVPIDPLDNRLFAAGIFKNKITGKNSLWTAHAVGVNQSGNYVPDSVFVQQARTGSRWYEIDNIYTQPHLNQWGTIYDPLQASGNRAVMYFNPSIAANGQGHAVVGGTTAAYNQYLNAFISGRYKDDASGTLGMPQKVTGTQALYALVYGNYFGRWGDFSQTVVDPLDNQTIWTFQEYAHADDSYGVRALQEKAPPPATPLPLGILSDKSDTVITLTGISINHSAFFDPGNDQGGPGYNRLSVKSTGDILVSNLKFISPTQIRFKLNTKNKTPGLYTLVITNPDGQFTLTSFIILPQWFNSIVMGNKQEEKNISSGSAYPNPTQNNFKLQIKIDNELPARIILMDAAGKQLSETKYNFTKGNNEVTLSVAGYDKGTFIVAVFNEKNRLLSIHKVIKQ